MIPATLAVALALSLGSHEGHERRRLDRHVCLVDHGCAADPLVCLLDEGRRRDGDRCAPTLEICLVGTCDDPAARPGLP